MSPAAPLRHGAANREVRLGEQLVAYLLQRSARRTIGFIVGPDGLLVRAPRSLDQRHIDTALQAKAGWILRKLAEQGERLGQQDTSRPHWQHGMTLPYLGAPLCIELRPELPVPLRHQPEPATLQLRLPADAAPEHLRHVVQRWLQTQARELLVARCHHFAPQLQVQPSRVLLSAARTRWGSANSQGQIRLNWRLIHQPPALIDYVVVHELAHLREMNHGPAFWALVAAVLPDHVERRRALKSNLLHAID